MAKRVKKMLDRLQRVDNSSSAVLPISYEAQSQQSQALQLVQVNQADIPNQLFHLTYKTKSMKLACSPTRIRHHLTRQGQIVASIRRMLCNASAHDFGGAILQDIHGTTITQAERIFGASRIASLDWFHRDHESDIAALTRDDNLPAIACHCFSFFLSFNTSFIIISSYQHNTHADSLACVTG